MAEVGTSKVYENDKMIVWEFVLEAGAQTPLHTHKHDYVFYVLDGAPLQINGEHGEDLGIFDAVTGAVFPLNIDGNELVSADDKGLRIAATHTARNIGSNRYREILVESK